VKTSSGQVISCCLPSLEAHIALHNLVIRASYLLTTGTEGGPLHEFLVAN
jgi:hypothetical protein